MTAKHDLDARGLLCPLPILKFKKLIRSLPEGETVVVRTTDPDSVNDFESFAKMKGYKIIDHQQSDYDFVFWIRV